MIAASSSASRVISIHALRVEGDLLLLRQTRGELISIHALRVEGDIQIVVGVAVDLEFLSTPSGWRATCPDCGAGIDRHISIHALRVEGDEGVWDYRVVIDGFLSTPSGWRATTYPQTSCSILSIFLSTPSGWRATTPVSGYCIVNSFLSTPSGWRATKNEHHGELCSAYFYPRPPGGGRQRHDQSTGSGCYISIHALRVEGDQLLLCLFHAVGQFLSTPSGWRATAKTDKVFVCFCAKGRRICLFKTRKEKNLPVAF